VISSTRRIVWEPDLRHVQTGIVERVTRQFLLQHLAEANLAQVEALEEDFSDWPVPAVKSREPSIPNFISARPGDHNFPAGFPRVTSSSAMASDFDASCLMSPAKRIWHSERPPSFPEWLQLDFERPLRATRLCLQSQAQHPERAPTCMALEALDRDQWLTLLSVRNAAWKRGDEWQIWKIEREPISARRYRLMIFASGDRNLVTVQNMYLAP
jgi:hypothetical protein